MLKKNRKLCEHKIYDNAADENIGTDSSVFFLFHNGYYLLKNIEVISNLSCLEITNETAGSFLH